MSLIRRQLLIRIVHHHFVCWDCSDVLPSKRTLIEVTLSISTYFVKQTWTDIQLVIGGGLKIMVSKKSMRCEQCLIMQWIQSRVKGCSWSNNELLTIYFNKAFLALAPSDEKNAREVWRHRAKEVQPRFKMWVRDVNYSLIIILPCKYAPIILPRAYFL